APQRPRGAGGGPAAPRSAPRTRRGLAALASPRGTAARPPGAADARDRALQPPRPRDARRDGGTRGARRAALGYIEPATFERCALIRDRVPARAAPVRLTERRRCGDAIAQLGLEHRS